jgi:hypothetical protein
VSISVLFYSGLPNIVFYEFDKQGKCIILKTILEMGEQGGVGRGRVADCAS